jgi:hypothetical protein
MAWSTAGVQNRRQLVLAAMQMPGKNRKGLLISLGKNIEGMKQSASNRPESLNRRNNVTPAASAARPGA